MDLSELLRATYAMFRPPKARTVSEWADENRVLVSESSSEPGPWRTDRAPYQREIMDAFTQPGIYEIVIMASAQVGKSPDAVCTAHGQGGGGLFQATHRPHDRGLPSAA